MVVLVFLPIVLSFVCHNLTEYPVYVIHLSQHKSRSTYMRSTFGNEVRFVEAVNGTDANALRDQLVDVPSVELLREEKDKYSIARTGASRGQLGNTVSLLNAMHKAINDGVEYAVIAEDDVSDSLKCLWPGSLSAYVKYANLNHPGWYSIRLEWGLHRPLVNALKRDWYRMIKSRMSESERRTLGRRWGNWTGNEPFPIMMPSTAGWGTVAVLWNMRGMQHMVNELRQQSSVLRGRDANKSFAVGKWKCPTTFRCVSDNFFWNMWSDNTTLVTTPPLIGCRMAESPTPEIRRADLNNLMTHVAITATNAHWMLETFEMMQPRPPHTWPPKFQYTVGNEGWS